MADTVAVGLVSVQLAYVLTDELILCLFEYTDQGRLFLTVDLVSDDFSCSSVSNKSYINHTVCTFLFHQMEWAELS